MMLLIRKRSALTLGVCVCVLLLCGVSLQKGITFQSLPAFAASGAPEQPVTVVIDPGHGGEDGGAVSPDGVEEGSINLAVALRLESLLRFAGVPTEMTRRSDEMVCDPGLSTMRQRKVSDIHNRVAMVNDTSGAVLLSIHQNSLPSSTVTHGAQAFWNRQVGAETLAEGMQTELNTVVNTHRAKEPKPIAEDIYLLNHVTAPAVLVECGFLSNEGETALLQTPAHQTILAAVIAASCLRWAAEEG